MFKATANDYSKYVDIELDKKLEPVNQSIDEMLTRLEEFETMVTLVQQERCNAMGLTGTLVETMDYQSELKTLCARVDKLEQLIEYIKTHLNGLEGRLDAAEEEYGLVDNSHRIKNFLMPLFKKSAEVKQTTPSHSHDLSQQQFSIENFFIRED